MGYRTPVGIARSGAAIRVYRAAALNAGNNPTPAEILWDATAASPAKVGFEHSTVSDPAAVIVDATGAGRCLVKAAVAVAGAVELTEFRVELLLNGAVVRRRRIGASAGLLDPVPGPWTLAIGGVLDLSAGDVLRLRNLVAGVSNHPLLTGDAETYLSITAMR